MSPPIAYLYGPGNAYVTQFYVDSDAAVKLPSTGTYLLAIAGQNAANASVSYSFEVFDNVNPTSALTLGTGVSGTIANPGDSHSYTFTGSAGQRIYYDGLASAKLLPVCRADQPVRHRPLQLLLQRHAGPFTLAYSGTYTLTVYSSRPRGRRGPTPSRWTTR